MTYTPTTWVNGSTPVSAANMTNIENGISNVDTRLTAIEGGTNGAGKASLLTGNWQTTNTSAQLQLYDYATGSYAIRSQTNGGSIEITGRDGSAAYHRGVLVNGDGSLSLANDTAQMNATGKLWINRQTAYGSGFPTTPLALAIGDNDTGIDWGGDGIVAITANGTKLLQIANTAQGGVKMANAPIGNLSNTSDFFGFALYGSSDVGMVSNVNSVSVGSAAGVWVKYNTYFDGTTDRAYNNGAAFQFGCIGSVNSGWPSMRSSQPITGGTGSAITWNSWNQVWMSPNGGRTIFVQSTAPATPVAGDIWIDTSVALG